MKTIKFLTLAAAALTLAAGCNKGESYADLAVTTDKTAITVKTEKPSSCFRCFFISIICERKIKSVTLRRK